jgi:hypothetical protein
MAAAAAVAGLVQGSEKVHGEAKRTGSQARYHAQARDAVADTFRGARSASPRL